MAEEEGEMTTVTLDPKQDTIDNLRARIAVLEAFVTDLKEVLDYVSAYLENAPGAEFGRKNIIALVENLKKRMGEVK